MSIEFMEHDCTVTIDNGEHYKLYLLGTFKLNESERLLTVLSEVMSLVHNELTKHNFLELEWQWNQRDLNCIDLLRLAKDLKLIVDYTFE